ncbi:DUF4179 domain-containing protein [Paenibacillus rhizophilus]|uniref:DUF4179 domain-containing protein n=1 Tax=Paenibacillus rhizophilus TaxID=1850366 RepID=A0A3N9PB81_9BACL|nr:DUF4179 domain-containing protein [Paenibacillus rhizophilus]RQW13523.1 DUF4179 domain-containing protein [Paenibacillus rhizophilus]
MKNRHYTNLDNMVEDELPLHRIYASVRLPDEFTEQVMENLRHTEMLPAPRRSRDWYRMRVNHRLRPSILWGSAALVASAMSLLIISILSALGTTRPISLVPKPVSELSQRPPLQVIQWVDNSLAEAQALGIVQQPSVEVSDKGYTLSLQDVIADSSRLVLSLQITDESGRPDKGWTKSRFDNQQLRILNEDGEEIGYYLSKLPLEHGSNNEKSQKLWLTYVFSRPPGDNVIIEGNVQKLYVGDVGTEPVSGKWSFSYTADMTKSKKLTATNALDDSYTTPAGLKINMRQLVHTPIGAQLQFDTSLTDEASALSTKGLGKQLMLNYHFEDENGRILSKVNGPGSYTGFPPDVYLNHFATEDAQTGTQHWTYSFSYLPYDSMKVRFVLDSYSIPVQSEDSVTFRPEKLREQPVVLEAQGDIFKIHAMDIEKSSNEPGLSGHITVSGEVVNSFNEDRWIARDESGKEYKVYFVGNVRNGNTITIDEPKEGVNSKSYLDVLGMTAMPQKLTLIRNVTDKKYTDVNWSFELPQIERH